MSNEVFRDILQRFVQLGVVERTHILEPEQLARSRARVTAEAALGCMQLAHGRHRAMYFAEAARQYAFAEKKP